MSTLPYPPSWTGARRALHGGLFVLLLLYWSYLLVKPSPVPENLLEGIPWFDLVMLKFILAKTLHLCSYIFMAVLGGSLLPPGRLRTALYVGLIAHGALAELAQWLGNMYFQTNRFGSVRDVVIDAVGVGIGAYILKRWDRISTRRLKAYPEGVHSVR